MWLAKLTVAAVNLLVFGILSRNGDGWSFSEGFWCAVVSIVISGVICIALLWHFIVAFGNESDDTQVVRTQGKRFMLSVTAFIGILGVQSLAFCKIEKWAYSDATYFSVQVCVILFSHITS